MNDKERIKAITTAIIAAARKASEESEVEDAAYMFGREVESSFFCIVEKEAKRHIEKPVLNSSSRYNTLKHYDMVRDIAFFFPLMERAVLEHYELCYDENVPDLPICNVCGNEYWEDDCPTCENRRFESDHAKGKI